MDLAAGSSLSLCVPGPVKVEDLPHRVTIEVVNWLQILIEIYIRSEWYVSVVSRLEVSHTAGRYAKTPEH